MVKQGRPVSVNGRLLKIFGFDGPEEIAHRPLVDFVHPDDREGLLRLWRSEKKEEGQTPYEFRGIRKDGNTIHLEASVARITYLGEPLPSCP